MTPSHGGVASLERVVTADEELTLPAETSAVPEARRFAEGWLVREGLGHLSDTVVLLVSEVVTNAVLYGGSPVRLRLSPIGDDGVRVEVRDASVVLPVTKRYSDTAATGRGLVLVEAMSDGWGTSPEGDGKVVWFEFDPGHAEATR